MEKAKECNHGALIVRCYITKLLKQINWLLLTLLYKGEAQFNLKTKAHLQTVQTNVFTNLVPLLIFH